MEQPVLTSRGLTMRYHNTVALDDLNLDLPKGKIIGLLGPNGSGKTTFIKLAAGVLTPKAKFASAAKPWVRSPNPWFPIFPTVHISVSREKSSNCWTFFRIFILTSTEAGQSRCLPPWVL